MTCVADTSPLLHLARIGHLDIVPAVAGDIVIPQSVWDELTHPGTRREVVAAFQTVPWLHVEPDPPHQDLGLDRGETFAVLLAEMTRAEALLIDERLGRAVALELGISVLGTLGLVAGARRAGVLERAAPVIASLREDGFWLSDALVAELLTDLGEEP